MKSNKKWSMLTLIMMFWFTISFITNILGPLIPDIIHNFELKDLAMAGFIPTSFFLAYAIMSIPAGILIDKYGEKPVLFTGFLMPFIGTTLFACFPFYLILLLSSFIIGLGMAMLQTVINPLQRVVGGEENYAFIAELAQFVFGVASFISPLVYTWLIHALEPEVYQQGQNFLLDILAKVTPVTLPWVSLYWVFTALLLAMLLVVSFVHFPRIELKDDERSGSSSSYKKLFRQKYVWLFFLGIFCYVSTEQGVSIFMSTFLEQYHGIDPKTVGAQSISYFWGSMTVGCLFGMFLLKLIDSKRLLQISGLLSTLDRIVRFCKSCGMCISGNRFLHFNDVLHRILTGSEHSSPESRFFCRYSLLRNCGRRRRSAVCQSAIRYHFITHRNAPYLGFHGIYYVYRFLGTSTGQQ